MEKPIGGCGKQLYPTSHEARMAIGETQARAKKGRGQRKYGLQRPYYCSLCEGWHLTSMTKEEWQAVQRRARQV